ncbi:MAG: TetR family transcriptional regulator [Planctomycetota bacterium]
MSDRSTETPIRHSTRQERSRRTAQSIVEAARELFTEHEYEQVSVAEIAAQAQVSVGCLYARFPDKAALALAVEADVLGRARRAIGRAMDPTALSAEDVAGVLRSYVRTMLRFFRRHRRLMRTLSLRTRRDERYSMLEQVQEFNRFAHGMLCRRLLERRREINHPRPEEAARFGIMMISAAAREMIFYGESRANLSTIKGRELEAELLRAFCGYLGCPCPRD